jgi:hypothetical protein
MSVSRPFKPAVRNRRSSPLWIAGMLFLAAAVSVPMVTHFRQVRHRRLLPQNCAQLVEQLHQAAPELQVVPGATDGNLDMGGVYFCTEAKTREELSLLSRQPERIASWRGVVFASRPPRSFETRADDWGEHGLLVGNVFLFGDAQLLARIREFFKQGKEKVSGTNGTDLSFNS